MGYVDLPTIVVFGVLRFFASVILAVLSVYFGVRAFDKLTQGIHEIKELKKGNMAVAIMTAAIIIAIAAMVRSGVHEFSQGIQPEYSISLLLAVGFINLVKLAFGLIAAVITIYLSLNMLDRLTEFIDEVKELKKGNAAIAVLVAGVLISVAFVVDAGIGGVMDSEKTDACIFAVEMQEKGLPIDAAGCVEAPVKAVDGEG